MSEQKVTTRTITVTAPVTSDYIVRREKTPIYEGNVLVGYTRGKIILEMPADVDIQFKYE